MAGFDPQLVTPTLTASPSGGSGVSSPLSAGAAVGPHHAVIAFVLLAVLVLFLLDRAGFRFAVTVGRS